MKSIYGIVICALLATAFIGSTAAYIHSLQSELIEANRKVKEYKKAEALALNAEARARAARQVENEKAKQRERLMENVLCHNGDWSDIVVPDDVCRMLKQGGAELKYNGEVLAPGNSSR